MKYYLDTNTCSYFMSQRYPQVTARLKSCEPKDLVIPSIVAAELAAGVENSAPAHKENNRIRLQALLSERFGCLASIKHVFGAQAQRLASWIYSWAVRPWP
jgi:predicted nucleic acid-binding protein